MARAPSAAHRLWSRWGGISSPPVSGTIGCSGFVGSDGKRHQRSSRRSAPAKSNHKKFAHMETEDRLGTCFQRPQDFHNRIQSNVRFEGQLADLAVDLPYPNPHSGRQYPQQHDENPQCRVFIHICRSESLLSSLRGHTEAACRQQGPARYPYSTSTAGLSDLQPPRPVLVAFLRRPASLLWRRDADCSALVPAG